MTLIEMPYDIEAEAAVLGAVLLNRDAMVAVAPILQAGDFYLPKHQQIYGAMVSAYAERVPPDVRIVSSRLRDRGELDAVGGFPYLASLVDGVVSFHVEHYARIVEGHAVRRRLIGAAEQIVRLGYDAARPVDEVLAEASAALAATGRRADNGMVPMSRVADELYERLRSGEVRSIKTGLYRLDDLIGGLCPGDLCIVAGRPGHGKSSLALTIADTLAQQGEHVAYFTLEMRRDELAQRLIAMRSGVSATTQRQQSYTDEEMAAVAGAIGEIASLPIALCDQRGLTIADLRNRALRHAASVGRIGLVVVDYLTLVEAHTGRGMNRAQAVGEISRGLKRLAGEADCPVMALAQLNRQIDGRAENEPELSDLRESGDIEADADQVVFVVRPELYHPDGDALRGVAKLYVKKNRHGETGVAVVGFDGVRTTLRNFTARAVEGY